ncbi:hypothetical protein [Ferdinandcohnia sp. Marseille-Q9671]
MSNKIYSSQFKYEVVTAYKNEDYTKNSPRDIKYLKLLYING